MIINKSKRIKELEAQVKELTEIVKELKVRSFLIAEEDINNPRYILSKEIPIDRAVELILGCIGKKIKYHPGMSHYFNLEDREGG